MTTKAAAPVVNVEYLKMLQSVVDRLAHNSFQTKNWSVGLAAAILALGSLPSRATTCVLAFFPAICFAALDIYYLRQERLFRALYRAAAAGIAHEFSMDTRPYKDKTTSLGAVIKSPALWLVHGAIMVLIALVVIAAFTILSSAKGAN
jgi:hypothetical protein